jgi:hypothetical protein
MLLFLCRDSCCSFNYSQHRNYFTLKCVCFECIAYYLPDVNPPLLSTEPGFVNVLRSQGIDSQPGGIDSSKSIPGLHKRGLRTDRFLRYTVIEMADILIFSNE